MAHTRRQDTFDDSEYESCPLGGSWWKCQDVNYPTFIGCCSSNPCSGQMCPANNLYPMGFGSITTPVPDYPNHSCPYGGLWYTCADNSIAFQGCCESDPCNGQGCPASDLRPAALHTVDVAGSSTFTVPSSVATAVSSKTATAVSSKTAAPAQSAQSMTSKPDTAAIAGGAAAAGLLVAAIIGISLYCCLRRKRANRVAANDLHPPATSHGHKDYYQGAGISALTSVPNSAKAVSPLPFAHNPASPAPTYTSTWTKHNQEMEPQEIMGLGLSAEEFNRRTKSRSPVQVLDGPVELASQRFSVLAPEVEAQSPLLQSRPAKSKERASRLRSSPRMSNLRAQASRSPSRSPARSVDSDI